MSDERFESLGGGVYVCVSPAHTFGSDAVLLADFAAPKPRERCADLCSGCGIISLLWMSCPNPPKEATAIDIQTEAVRQIMLSAQKSNLESKLMPMQADLRDPTSLGHGCFDLCTCNPPYRAVGTGIISQSDSDRAARHETMCTLDDVCRAAAYMLRFGGRLCMCHLPERLVDVLATMRAHAIEPKRIRFVQQRADSPPWLVLIEGKRGAKPFVTVEAPIIIENGDARAMYNMQG